MLFANEGVSIHAPWEGCDVTISALVKVKRCFNSRTLGRVRRVPLRVVSSPGDVSIHAPWEGCDSGVGRYTPTSLVSIHAPWEGCDVCCLVLSSDPTGFNSRTLGRVRPSYTLKPAWILFRVSIHAPWEGCDRYMAVALARSKGFNSRTLGRVRLGRRNEADIASTVSIHAPWEGCDVQGVGSQIVDTLFQFTHPGKGATVWCKGAYYRADKQA